ncbi:hypothetical protein CupriaWKF_31190 [Cupriavidus sp. WKF15]|uniref:hypothetical protein n=1 Tax=Cupriavidus sp. WKF15 TaxID=3032282 RepID=UPI0023E16101|nr:hypothetical protein [Cupriavidus sp. WKF15]WER50819.1 hypothetical protein CupriaWKF_31190 [Cupriavidus sp. WKF15]
MTTVRIGIEEHDLEKVLESPADYARALERAKKLRGYAECRCNMTSPRPKLVIRAHGKIFILARWPVVVQSIKAIPGFCLRFRV